MQEDPDVTQSVAERRFLDEMISVRSAMAEFIADDRPVAELAKQAGAIANRIIEALSQYRLRK
jgi:hypothetical protein